MYGIGNGFFCLRNEPEHRNVRKFSKMKKLLLSAMFIAMFMFTSLVSAKPVKEVRVDLDLIQAYDGLGNYYVQYWDGNKVATSANVTSPRKLDGATLQRWDISVRGSGIPGVGEYGLSEGWIESVGVRTGLGFPKSEVVHWIMVTAKDPRFKHAINAGPTPPGWVYIMYEVSKLGGRGWGHFDPR